MPYLFTGPERDLMQRVLASQVLGEGPLRVYWYADRHLAEFLTRQGLLSIVCEEVRPYRVQPGSCLASLTELGAWALENSE